MIPQNPPKTQPKESAWQEALKSCAIDLETLAQRLHIDPQAMAALVPDVKLDFPLRVPPRYLDKIKKSDLHDPLLLQILPLRAEFDSVPGFSPDPLQEARFNPVPGLIHKYRSRALVTPTGACAIHCRYCFRRHFPYHDNNPGKKQWAAILDYLASETEICEIILSGGDPLMLKDRLLETFIQALAEIPHIQYLRIHSRLLSTIPERVTAGLIRCLTLTRLKCVIVLHVNHPNEIDDALKQALHPLLQANVTLFNQSVLLKQINDCSDTLAQLQKKLFSCGVLPYYLHILDRVSGSAHFEVDITRAKTIMIELMSKLPGYLVPKLVQEIPGAPAKMPIPLLY